MFQTLLEALKNCQTSFKIRSVLDQFYILDKIDELLDAANKRLKQSNAGIKILKRGQKLSLRGMLPPKPGKEKQSQQIISLGIYCNAAGLQSAEKQAQKLASQLALKEFKWDDWTSDNKNVGSVGYWVKEFETDYFNRKEKNDRSLTTWDKDYKSVWLRNFLRAISIQQ